MMADDERQESNKGEYWSDEEDSGRYCIEG